jgi:hypothetical protein
MPTLSHLVRTRTYWDSAYEFAFPHREELGRHIMINDSAFITNAGKALSSIDSTMDIHKYYLKETIGENDYDDIKNKMTEIRERIKKFSESNTYYRSLDAPGIATLILAIETYLSLIDNLIRNHGKAKPSEKHEEALLALRAGVNTLSKLVTTNEEGKYSLISKEHRKLIEIGNIVSFIKRDIPNTFYRSFTWEKNGVAHIKIEVRTEPKNLDAWKDEVTKKFHLEDTGIVLEIVKAKQSKRDLIEKEWLKETSYSDVDPEL